MHCVPNIAFFRRGFAGGSIFGSAGTEQRRGQRSGQLINTLLLIVVGGESMHRFPPLAQNLPPLVRSVNTKSCLVEFWHRRKCKQAKPGKRLHIFGILALAEIVSALSLVVVLKQEECECGIWN